MARTEFGSLDHISAWIAAQPRATSYGVAAGARCLVCRYGEAHGVGSADDPATYVRTRNLMRIDDAQIRYLTSGDHRGQTCDFDSAFKRAIYA